MTDIILPDDAETPMRHARLQRILAAAQSFCCLCEEGSDQGTRLDRLNTGLCALEDGKGTLHVLWKSQADLDEFAALIDIAWRYQLEGIPPQHGLAQELTD